VKRVLYFSFSMVAGGAERIVLEHLKRLSRERFVPELVLCRKTGEYLPLVPDDVAVHELRGFGVSRLLWRRRSLRRLLRSRPYDALVSHLPYCDLVSLIAGTSVPRVCHLHAHLGSVAEVAQQSFVNRTRWRLLQRLYRKRAAALIVHTARTLEGIEGLEQVRAVEVPNAVEAHVLRARAQDAAPPNWPGPGTRVVAVGRLARQKRFDVLLRGMAHARAAGIEASLVIVGEGPERAALEGLVGELGLQDRVALPGYSDNPFPAVRHADLFVLSSDWEGFPIVILESMALGTPVLSTDCPTGPGEMLAGGVGRLVPTGDPRALGDALAEMTSSPAQLAECAAHGQARAADFSWERLMPRIESLLADLQG